MIILTLAMMMEVNSFNKLEKDLLAEEQSYRKLQPVWDSVQMLEYMVITQIADLSTLRLLLLLLIKFKILLTSKVS